MIALNPDVAHCGAATLVVACQQAGVALCMPLGISDAYGCSTWAAALARTSMRRPAEITFRPYHLCHGCERTLYALSCRIIGAVCSSDAAPRRIGLNHSRRFCHLMMAGWCMAVARKGIRG